MGVIRARSRVVNLRQLDRQYLGRESEVADIQVARTKGAFVYDARGKRYIDFLSGWCKAVSDPRRTRAIDLNVE